MKAKILMSVLMVLFQLNTSIMAQSEKSENSNDKLVVLWTSDDPNVAERVALMYTHAAKTAGWFKDVTLVVWGPSAKLISENSKLQQKVKEMQKDGVIIEACVVCADSYGVSDVLRSLGYDVKAMGKPLTDYLKSEAKILTF